jgi:hypothetical protein
VNKKYITSPCVGVCSIDPQSGLCIGCLRSSSEIAIWPQIDNQRALQIMREIKGRSISKKLD